jgi:hypothetical protein
MHILFFYLYKNALKNQTKNIACQKLNTQQNQAYVYKFHWISKKYSHIKIQQHNVLLFFLNIFYKHLPI